VEPWTTRTYIRAGFAAVLAGLTAAGTALVGDSSITANEGVAIAIAAVTAFGSWLGIGALPNTGIEPFYGAKGNEPVAVPDREPPAVPVPPSP
jgi:hypothetical protein